MATSSAHDLHIVPLGAGDLIDRAVRLYRRHLFTLMRIAAPPVIVSAMGWVLFTIGWRRITTETETGGVVFDIFLMLGGAVVVIAGHIFSLIVMGGASRNLVAHLLWNEPVLARSTYAAVRSRFWSLLGASILVVIWLWISSTAGSVAVYIVMMFLGILLFALGQLAPAWMTIIAIVCGGITAVAVFLWSFFFLAGKVAYVPQVLLVEGKGVFDAVGRSFTLARGNVRRLMAMTLFIVFVTYSALMILVIPLGWYGYLNGIDLWNAAQWPVWYAIAYSVLEPVSSIMLAPVWMLGMSLMYVDERVRHEGYDIELMASQKLPPMPEINVLSPLAPALSAEPGRGSRPPLGFSGSTLGLR
jgi:hypothetical protein